MHSELRTRDTEQNIVCSWDRALMYAQYAWENDRMGVVTGLIVPTVIAVAVAVLLASVGFSLVDAATAVQQPTVSSTFANATTYAAGNTSAARTQAPQSSVSTPATLASHTFTNTTGASISPPNTVDAALLHALPTAMLVLIVVGVVVWRVAAVVQPVSQQVVKYISGPQDHSKKLAYQHEVIRDINFLLTHARAKDHNWQQNEWQRRIASITLLPYYVIKWLCASLGWLLAILWHSILWCFGFPWPARRIPLQPLAKHTRIVVLVDDLDRCQPDCIMQVR